MEKIRKIIKNNSCIFTHCFSQTVINFLISEHSNKNFTVYTTETRPKLLGRKTAKELANHGIPVIHMPDNAAHEALEKCDLILLGVESIDKNGNIFNKIGSNFYLKRAKELQIPAFALTYRTKINAKISRPQKNSDVWKNPPPNVEIYNPGFEKITPDLIKVLFID